MTASSTQLFTASNSNIETLRVIATVLLVSYHGIGSDGGDALGVDYPHPLRFLVDLLLDVRMPMFAFIAGWVYAQRSVIGSSFSDFALGKIRRLIIPGLIAAILFYLSAHFFNIQSLVEDNDYLNVLTLSFAHYWFLQAIFLILLSIALAETLLGRELQAGTIIVLMTVFAIAPVPHSQYVQVSSAVYLAFYFLLGVLIARNDSVIRPNRLAITAIAAVIILVALYLNVRFFLDEGRLNLDRRDVQSYLMASGTIVLLYLSMRRISALTLFGPASFTIYLYHVYGTSAARRVLDPLGMDNVWLSALFVTSAGILLPLALHFVLVRFELTRRIFLGMRKKKKVAIAS